MGVQNERIESAQTFRAALARGVRLTVITGGRQRLVLLRMP